jgi:hypothetical protein
MVPAIAALPKVNVHGAKLGKDNFTIGRVNEKMVMPRNAYRNPVLYLFTIQRLLTAH